MVSQLVLIEDTFTPMIDRGENSAKYAEEALLEYGIQIENYAQANAPWEDRTGEARDGLGVEVDEDGETVTLTLYHSVEYGFWLETIQSGRFAIILPTLELFGTEALQAAGARIVGRISGG